MKVYTTNHFHDQLKNRALHTENDMALFYEAIALIKKKKIRPTKQPGNALRIYHKNCNFIYQKTKGSYTLITFYRN